MNLNHSFGEHSPLIISVCASFHMVVKLNDQLWDTFDKLWQSNYTAPRIHNLFYEEQRCKGKKRLNWGFMRLPPKLYLAMLSCPFPRQWQLLIQFQTQLKHFNQKLNFSKSGTCNMWGTQQDIATAILGILCNTKTDDLLTFLWFFWLFLVPFYGQ